MNLLRFIRTADPSELRAMLLLTVIAGCANGLLVVMINTVAGYVAEGKRAGLEVWVIFGLAFAVYYICNRLALVRSTRIIETLLQRLRLDIVDRLRSSELPDIERLGRGRLYHVVAQESNHLSIAFPMMVDSFQQFVLLSVSMVYLLYLSPPAFSVFSFGLFLCAIFYLLINERYAETLKELGDQQAQMLDAVSDVVDGAKEMRLNAARTFAIQNEFAEKSFTTETILVRAGEYWATLLMIGSVTAYFILGVVAFGFPGTMTRSPMAIFELIPVLLFCIGPPARIIGYAPTYIRARVGLNAILEIQEQLSHTGSVSTGEARELAKPYKDFRTIEYNALRFSYPAQGEAGFSVGPVSLTVSRGETLFIVGGNGSGKSTTLRLITGLYRAKSGKITVDGKPVRKDQVPGLRELFSAVFADFHLFDRLYGLEGIDPARVDALLEEFGLADKVRYENGAFTERHLSTGQSKRLALIGALLEDREIYIFDEWSAEQDVEYRRYFYTKVLAQLKAAGKTVIAVTHDERFFHHADRVIKLEMGKIAWERRFTAEGVS